MFALLASSERATAAVATFTPLDVTSVDAISGNGAVVAAETSSGLFLWTANGGPELVTLPAGQKFFNVRDLSSDGATVVGGIDIIGFPASHQGFRWTRIDGFQLLGNLSPDPSRWSYATGVSADGSVVVGTNDTPDGQVGYRWTESTGKVPIGKFSPGAYTDTSAVSADGEIIVGGAPDPKFRNYSHAYRWTSATSIGLIPYPLPNYAEPLPQSFARAISGDGSVIAGFASGLGMESAAFTWTESTGMINLPSRSDRQVQVHGISFDGSVIVGTELIYGTPSPRPIHLAAAWIERGGEYKPYLVTDLLGAAGLELTGWVLSDAIDVSDDGLTIIGAGIDPAGQHRAWVANFSALVPEPGSFDLILFALLGAPRIYRRAMASEGCVTDE